MQEAEGPRNRIEKAYSSEAEYTAHNGRVVGSIPTRLNIVSIIKLSRFYNYKQFVLMKMYKIDPVQNYLIKKYLKSCTDKSNKPRVRPV